MTRLPLAWYTVLHPTLYAEGVEHAREGVAPVAARRCRGARRAAQPACSPRTRAPSAVTLRLLATTGNVPAWQAWKANFERANPDITIALEHLNVAQYPQVLLTQLQAGNGPDLIYTQGGTGQIHSVLNLGESGRLVDLSKQPWVKRLPASARPLFTQGKNVFALPLAFVPTGILYNVDAFKQLNLKIPTTFAQLLNVCRTAKDKGKTAFTFSGSTTNSATLTQLIASSSVYGRTRSGTTRATRTGRRSQAPPAGIPRCGRCST